MPVDSESMMDFEAKTPVVSIDRPAASPAPKKTGKPKQILYLRSGSPCGMSGCNCGSLLVGELRIDASIFKPNVKIKITVEEE